MNRISKNSPSNDGTDFIAPVCHADIELLYQDDAILLINKPSGLLSLSGKNPANKDSVHYRLVQDFPGALMIHRLDLGTSGVMILALNKTVNANLCRQFIDRKVTKTYTGLLSGALAEPEGMIDIPIIKDLDNFPYQKVCLQTGKPAQSRYRLLDYCPERNVSRVEFTPITGRTHQLRVHSQAIGHSILGCDLYASSEVGAMSNRLMLHATSLVFDHPTTGERTTGECPVPF
ncbi:MAG: pseudouridine synthase [Opitutaceae bacterium]|nr:pseudouridine synthase [Opitutaceae bacterium]